MEINIGRLQHLKEVLRRVRDENRGFNMAYWAELPPTVSVYDGSLAVGDPEMSCGTVCCAIGWASLDPTFIKDGLRLALVAYDWTADTIDRIVRNIEINSLNDFVEKVQEENLLAEVSVRIVYNDKADFFAIADFFGIKPNTAWWLFHSENYPPQAVTPDMVIERIDAVIVHGDDAASDDE